MRPIFLSLRPRPNCRYLPCTMCQRLSQGILSSLHDAEHRVPAALAAYRPVMRYHVPSPDFIKMSRSLIIKEGSFFGPTCLDLPCTICQRPLQGILSSPDSTGSANPIAWVSKLPVKRYHENFQKNLSSVQCQKYFEIIPRISGNPQ